MPDTNTSQPPGTRVVSRLANYGRVPESLLLAPGIPGDEIRLYAYLTTFDYGRSGTVWPGNGRAAEELGWSVRHVGRLLAALRQRGAIESVRKGRGHPNEILLLADVLPDDRTRESDQGDMIGQDDPHDRTHSGSRPLTNEKNESPSGSRARDLIFDALVEVFGPASTDSRGAFYGKVSGELRRAGATPEQIVERGRLLRSKGWTDSSPAALAKHWDTLDPGAIGPDPLVGTIRWDQ